MDYEVNYADGEKEGCSSKLEIEHRIFYIKLFTLPQESARYYAGDQQGILKEISKAVKKPLIILGCGDGDKDNKVLSKISVVLKGEKCQI
jgi:hypothetical protein